MQLWQKPKAARSYIVESLDAGLSAIGQKACSLTTHQAHGNAEAKLSSVSVLGYGLAKSRITELHHRISGLQKLGFWADPKGLDQPP